MYGCCAALSCAPGSLELGPVLGLTTTNPEVQPQTSRAGGRVEMVSRDMDKPSLGLILLLPLSISRILG